MTTDTKPEMRLAGPGDVGTIQALTDAAYRHYIPLLGGPPVPMTEDYAPRVAAGDVHLLVAEGAIAGLLVLEPGDERFDIFSVAVDPAHHGKGYGLFLLDWAAAEARRRGFGALGLYTNALMERNIALYARYGFLETGRRPHPQRPGFVIVDMVKPL